MRRHCLPSDRHAPAAGLVRSIGALGLCGLLALPAAAIASLDDHLGGGVPLVLKDGRIANVTVHTIPFATGAEMLDPATEADLEATFRPLATDCFLTAQAIGHVAPGIARDGDTLAAHRLARARADRVQAMLAGLGMPQPAVASVWDWQFLVQESQVTLWVFSLNVGDDCEGAPLPIDAPTLAAVSDTDPGPQGAVVTSAPTQASAPALPVMDNDAAVTDEPVATMARPLTLDDGAADALEAEADNGAEVAEPLPSAAASASPPTTTSGERAASTGQDPLATAATAPTRAPAATPPAAPTSTVVAALGPAGEDVATQPAVESGEQALVITFDVNSSFFPAGAGRQLRAFLDSLPPDAPVELELAAAVGTGDVRGASGEEAKRYNAWMAERRAQRVAEWLSANAGQRPITVTERFVENDPSRQVRLFASGAR